MLKRWLVYLAAVLAGLGLVGALLVAFVFALLYPTLPSLETLTDYQPKIPLKIVSAKAVLGDSAKSGGLSSNQEVPDVMRRAIRPPRTSASTSTVDYLSDQLAALANVRAVPLGPVRSRCRWPATSS
jgi:penicillin-binding protein 1A